DATGQSVGCETLDVVLVCLVVAVGEATTRIIPAARPSHGAGRVVTDRASWGCCRPAPVRSRRGGQTVRAASGGPAPELPLDPPSSAKSALVRDREKRGSCETPPR